MQSYTVWDVSFQRNTTDHKGRPKTKSKNVAGIRICRPAKPQDIIHHLKKHCPTGEGWEMTTTFRGVVESGCIPNSVK